PDRLDRGERRQPGSLAVLSVLGLPGDFLHEWDDIGGTSTFEATACSKLSPGNGLWPRRLRRWQIPAIPAVRTCDAFAPAPHTEPEPKFGVHPRRPVRVARKAGLLPATEPGKKWCVGMALGGQPSRGRTVRTRMMNTSNASMKSRRNCSVVLSVTSPSSVISPGVNWM